MFDKDNWYMVEEDLTEEQFKEVCTYLFINYSNKENYDRVEKAAKGANIEGFGVGVFDAIGVVKGKYYVDDLPSDEFENCIKITYQEFEEHLLKPSKMSCKRSSGETDTNTQEEPETLSKTITGVIGSLCQGLDVTLEFTEKGHVNVYSAFGEWHVDLNEENSEEQLLSILEAVKVLNKANRL